MGFNSAANLLFQISADTTGAENNVKAFRTLLGKDLSDLKGEFSSWSENVFGDLSKAGAGFTALTATVLAGGVAIAAGLMAAADKAADYALEIGRGSQRTGIAAEDMSRLRYAAELTRTSYDSLITGLTRFASTIDAGRDPSSKQAEWFHRIGISQKEVEDGSRNMLPLLYKVADAFHENMTATERTALARELFSRGGAELVAMLSKGSGALKEFGEEAQRLGLVMSTQDVQAAREYKAEVHYLKAELEGMALSIGKTVVPALENYLVGAHAIAGGMKGLFTQGHGFGNLDVVSNFMKGFTESGLAAMDRIKAATKAAMNQEGLEAPGADKVKEAAQNFYGLSEILETVKSRFAAATGEEQKIAAETEHLNFQVKKAQAELAKLRDAGKLLPEAYQREAEALAALPAKIEALAEEQRAKYDEKLGEKYMASLWHRMEEKLKHDAEIVDAEDDLQHRLAAQQDKGYAQEVASWDSEIQKLRDHLNQKGLLTAENEKLLASLQEAGRNKLKRAQEEAFAQELRDLQSGLAEMVQANFTSYERIEWSYQQDLVKYSAVEEEKKVKLAQGEAQQQAIRAQFDLNRSAALKKYQTDLQTLRNSQGWQGVFGSQFAQMIRGNQDLLREWAQSGNQAGMMMRVTMEGLKAASQEAFASMAQGMGQNIANAMVYKKSIGDAMRQAAASTLESLSAQALVYAIYSTALGFLRLAQWDFAAAANAFTSAAIWGAVGAGAGLAGRAIAPSQGGAGASGAAGAASGASSADTGVSSGSNASQGPPVHIYVSGPIVGASGIEELTDMINDAVRNRDVRLVATQVRQTTRATA